MSLHNLVEDRACYSNSGCTVQFTVYSVQCTVYTGKINLSNVIDLFNVIDLSNIICLFDIIVLSNVIDQSNLID